MDRLIDLLLSWCIYALAALPLTLISGQGGLLSLAQGAYFGVGAYAAALLATHTSASFAMSLIAGFLLASVIAGLSAAILVRLRGDTFILASLALVVGCSALALGWMDLTRGPLGLSGIPPPRVGLCFADGTSLMTAAFYVVVLGVGAVWISAVNRGGLALRLRATREGQTFSLTLGENIAKLRGAALFLAGGVTGFAGVLHAHKLQYVNPSVFDTDLSLMFLAIILLGGADRVGGALFGAAVYVGVPELLRSFEIGSPANAANVNQIIFGLAIVAILLFRPQGAFGRVDIAAVLSRSE